MKKNQFQEVKDNTESHSSRDLSALGVLAGSIAHDLNNMLTGVLGHVSFLRLSLPDDPTYRQSIIAIEDGAKRASALIQQILDFSKGEEVQLGAVNLQSVIEAELSLFKVTIPKSIVLQFLPLENGVDDAYIFGESNQLGQLVMNLLVNAKDALNQKGAIAIALEKIELSREEAEEELGIKPGSYVRLLVSDNGTGISDEVKERIFEPFFTTKADSGTGLGLATVLRIVKAHRGVILVDSELGKGTTFEVLLPACDAPTEKKSTVVAQAERSLSKERILVVDDEEAVRMVMQRSLEHLGYVVDIAEGGDEAIQKLGALHGAYSLVILDMIMPGMSGDEVFFALRAKYPTLSVLVASGYSNDKRTRTVLDSERVGFIRKPFAIEELASAVRKLLEDDS